MNAAPLEGGAVWLFLLGGFTGSLHCVAMCGGFACALGGDARGPARSALRHAAYTVGRLASYAFLGAAAGAAGAALLGGGGGDGSSPGLLAQRLLALLSGGLLVWVGLRFFGIGRAIHGAGGSAALRRWAGTLRNVLRTPGLQAPLAFGVLNGLLPCPLVYAFLVQAATGADAAAGAWRMAVFGLGTVPAMLAMGGLGLWWRRGGSVMAAGQQPLRWLGTRGGGRIAASVDWRRAALRLGGGLIVLLGLVTLARGLLPMGGTLHLH